MLVSYRWLSELVDLHDLTPEMVAKKLTFAGVEVESIARLSTASNLVVGEVKKCELIPDTHLHLCEVDLGKKYGVKQIICGAPNVRKDLKVIVAMPGAKLPGGEIKVSTIRGYQSNGMCCSLLELGVDEKYVDTPDLTGIHELGKEFKVGEEDVLDKLGLDDVVLNLKLLANRPDLLSLYHVAQEVGTLFNRKVKTINEPIMAGKLADFKAMSVTNKCQLFVSQIFHDITVKESPLEIKKHLIAMGVRPINNIVDIGNYVMLLTGQPLHMYDLDKLPKQELVVRDDYVGDFVALDHKTYQVKKGDLVVTSDKKPMCLAGIMGGLESSDSLATKNIVVEAAIFDAAQIRRTSTRLNLISESSIRFTHGLNPQSAYEAVNLAAALIKKYCGAKEANEVKPYDETKKEAKQFTVTSTSINSVLGTDYALSLIRDTLKADHFAISKETKTSFLATVPNYRIDIDGLNDLAEEVVRILGFKDVKAELPKLTTLPGVYTEKQRLIKEIKNHLSSLGLYQTVSYTLVNEKRANEFRLLVDGAPLKIKNPMTDDHAYVRPGLIPSLLDVTSFNLARQNKDFGLFEISEVTAEGGKSLRLAIVLTGQELLQGALKKTPYNFYSLKGYLEAVMQIIGIEKNRYSLNELNFASNELHPTRSAVISLNKETIGYLGELHPSVYSRYQIKNNQVLVLELKLDKLLALPTGHTKFKAIPRFPTVTRDLALLVSPSTKGESVINLIKKHGGSLVKQVEIFDVYQDKNLHEQKSIAVTIALNKNDGTLKDAEINETMNKIVAALLKENIKVR
ncbi:MAG: phenylalanine--tRNA ligase subunit beta [Bacilli bacterium]|nr:phenylalanine--tRNA ligase subunit beta [Bacilli bacterium]